MGKNLIAQFLLRSQFTFLLVFVQTLIISLHIFNMLARRFGAHVRLAAPR